jgi:protein required for attachment to host cells
MRPMLVVVADLVTARFYRLPTDSRRLHLLEVLRNPAARSHEHELVSRPQRRVHSRADDHPQALGARTAAKRIACDRFAVSVAQRIAGRSTRHRNEDIVIVAGGRLLGLVDRKLPPTAQHRLVATVPRDLSHLSEAAIARQILLLRR